MTMIELVTYRVSEDSASPTLAGRYIMVYSAFYERGFGLPSH
jgi:hypothetical protein